MADEILGAYDDIEVFLEVGEGGQFDILYETGEYNNIWQGDAAYVPTKVQIGPGDKYEINIQKSGNNISFNTQIKGAPAQAGQTPIDMVVDLLKGSGFSKNHNDYPQTPEALIEQGEKYKKMYEFITKRKEGKGAFPWNQFELY